MGISCVTCFVWAGILQVLGTSLRHHLHYHRPDVWMSGVRDFDWYNHSPPAGTQGPKPAPRNLRSWLVGEPRRAGVYLHFLSPLGEFIFHHTPWRRVIGVEPIWLSLIRGTIGFAFLLGLFAYAAVQCVRLPIQESSGSLPVRDIGTDPSAFGLESKSLSLMSSRAELQSPVV